MNIGCMEFLPCLMFYIVVVLFFNIDPLHVPLDQVLLRPMLQSSSFEQSKSEVIFDCCLSFKQSKYAVIISCEMVRRVVWLSCVSIIRFMHNTKISPYTNIDSSVNWVRKRGTGVRVGMFTSNLITPDSTFFSV